MWIEEAGEAAGKIPFRFTGKECDGATGLYAFPARYYDPRASRWLSADPALAEYLPAVDAGAGDLPGEGGVFAPVNLAVYHYAGNNPLRYVDPTGSESVDAAYYRIVSLRVTDLSTAQDTTRGSPMYQRGAGGNFSIPGPTKTWCNQATFDIAEATGFDIGLLVGYSQQGTGSWRHPRWNAKANAVVAWLTLLARTQSPENAALRMVTPERAQELANEGYTVVAGRLDDYTSDRIGHLATVRPSEELFDPELEPILSNVGGRNGISSARRAFLRARSLDEVRYYYDPKQTFTYDPSKINRRP